ncbi:MAG: DUF2490 domain-containing protein [Myxococcales bacterium]|nr:DUF2490 domain-containing protein [Myxococcales bacterium]MCB9627758.1 DUF2490 domain-containing protein [Sandaracinaceae bacterium]
MRQHTQLTLTLLLPAMLAVGTSLGAPCAARAQVDRDHAVWAGAMATQELTRGVPGPSLWLDLHRRQDSPGAVMIIRPGIGLRITDALSLWVGYAWVPTYPDGSARRDEHRLWEQVIYSRALGRGVSFQARGRLEQRFAPNSDDVAHRFRQLLRLGWMHARQPVGFVVWDELFVGLADADWGAVAGYDQNRLFVGPIFRIASWARVEPGYLLVHLDRSPNRLVHAVAVNLFFTGTRD